MPKIPNSKQTLSYELCKTQKEITFNIPLTYKGTEQEFPSFKKNHFIKTDRELEKNQIKARQKPSREKPAKAAVRYEFQRA